MKLLIIHNILWSHYKSVLFEATERAKNLDMEIMVLQIAKNEVSRQTMEGLQVNYNYKYALLFDDFIENVPVLKKIFFVLRYIRNYNPDVVNIHGFGVDTSISLSILYAFILKKKIIISSESTRNDNKSNFLKHLLKKLLIKMADGFIVFGKSSKDYLLDFGVQESKILEQNAAVVDNKRLLEIYIRGEDEFNLTNKIPTKLNFIFVGRIIELKNLPLLINAFQNIKKKNPNASEWGLIILGNGNEELKITNLISENNTDIFKFDSVPWTKVPLFFRRSNCLILPSKSEPWGLVVNEAMICGLGVIVSDKCGCSEDLVKNNGFVFKSGNINELENCMNFFINHINERQKMQNASKEIIENFKVEEVAKRLINGIEEVYLNKI